jgi:hypothetical protein
MKDNEDQTPRRRQAAQASRLSSDENLAVDGMDDEAIRVVFPHEKPRTIGGATTRE